MIRGTSLLPKKFVHLFKIWVLVMEYIEDVQAKLKLIDEQNVTYFDIREYPQFVYGSPGFAQRRNFHKYPLSTEQELLSNEYSEDIRVSFRHHSNSTTGCRLRFKAKTSHIIIKSELDRPWEYAKMTLMCSSGFDVYTRKTTGTWEHLCAFAPSSGYRIFAEEFFVEPNSDIMIYLPCYNEVKQLLIGIESSLEPDSLPYIMSSPIAFYGQSLTQGASASRSGNAYPNIVSRIEEIDIVNYSMSSCCRGLFSVADAISSLKPCCIINDYVYNAVDQENLQQTHEPFYRYLRNKNPSIPIILSTAPNFNMNKKNIGYNLVVYETYRRAIDNGENTYIIDFNNIFKPEEYGLLAVDEFHLIDSGMMRLAKEVVNIYRKSKTRA